LYFGTNIDNITTGFVKKLVILFLLDVIDVQIMGKNKKNIICNEEYFLKEVGEKK